MCLQDGDGTVSKKEFRRAMPMLGFDVPVAEIDALFDEFDSDGGGDIGLGEMQRILRRAGGGAGGASKEARASLKSVKTANDATNLIKAAPRRGSVGGARNS